VRCKARVIPGFRALAPEGESGSAEVDGATRRRCPAESGNVINAERAFRARGNNGRLSSERRGVIVYANRWTVNFLAGRLSSLQAYLKTTLHD
jgi:hypothetical protein